MDKPSLETVCTAIDTLFHNQQVEGKDEASKWLDQFQHSVHAWEVADTLLRANRDPESTYFAAQTMKSKIQLQFAELPIQNHLHLRDSLITHLTQYSLASHAVITQLCLAVADLAVQSPQWTNPVIELIQKFSTKLENFSILLEILMMIPEELGRESLRIGANRKAQVYENLQVSSEHVYNLLGSCYDKCPKDERTQCKLYQCFGSWTTIGCFPPEQVAQCSLLQLAFQALMSDSTSITLHEAITDCLVNIIYTAGDVQHQMPLLEACFKFVSTNIPQAYASAMKEDNIDRSINYARILTELGESLLESMVYSPGQGAGSLGTLDLVLSCVQHPSHEVAEITFNFWYRFSELIEQTNQSETLDIFRPYVEKLIAELCRLTELDESHEGIVEKNDDFQSFRLRVLDVIQDIGYIVGSVRLFEKIYTTLTQSKPTWTKLEASLFIMNPIAKYMNRDDMVAGQVYQLMLHFPPNIHVAVRHTAMVLAGDLAHWIAHHEEYIDHVFQFLLNGFQTKELAEIAAISVAKFCKHSCHNMQRMFPVLLQVSKAVDSIPGLEGEAVIELLSGSAEVLSHLPTSEVTEGLMHLCEPLVQPLSQITDQGSTADPVKYLDRLACVFRNVRVNVAETEEHPCKKVIEQLWGLFKKIAEKYKADDRIMERHFRCVRFSIRCLGKDFAPLMQPLVELMVGIYLQHHHSCFLYLGSILVDEYGSNRAVEEPLLMMLKTFTQPTFTMLGREHGLMKHPDTVDDFFRLCIRFLQKATLRFLQNDSVNSIIQLAVAASLLDHREANMSVMKFYVELIKCVQLEPSHKDYSEMSQRGQIVQTLLMKYGQDIVTGLVNATAGGIQPYMLPEVADVFWELLTIARPNAATWFQNALGKLPSHSATGAVNATPEQIQQFYTRVTEASNIKVLWREFREFTRYFK